MPRYVVSRDGRAAQCNGGVEGHIQKMCSIGGMFKKYCSRKKNKHAKMGIVRSNTRAYIATIEATEATASLKVSALA